MPYYRGAIVSDAYLQGMLLAYRQGYVNAGGPDVEDGDQPILDKLSARGVVDNSGAAGVGAEDARIDIANKQDVHPHATIVKGGTVAPTAAIGTPPVINTVTSGGDAVAFMTLDGLPTGGGSAAPNQGAAALIAAGATPISAGSFSLSPSGGGIPWLLIAALAGAAYFLLKGK